MNHEHQVSFSRSSADRSQDIRADYRQVRIWPKASLEEGLDADPAVILDSRDGGGDRVVLRFVFRRNTGGLLRIVDKIWKQLEARFWRPKRHRITVRKNQCVATAIKVWVLRGLPEVLQPLVIDRNAQIDNRRITVIKVGTRELLEVFINNLWLACGLIVAHPGNQSEVDVRVDEARNQKQSFSRNHGRTRRLLRLFPSLDANDAAVFDQHTAYLDVI